jgi:hypothetical protein
MNKIIILPLSLYIDNYQQRTQAAFRKLGVGKWELIWQFMPLPSFLAKFRGPSLPVIFDQYRRGEFSTTIFRQKIREKFPQATFTNKEFDNAWNAMQEVTDVTHQAFNEAQALVKKGFKVYIIAGTNPLHVQDLKNKSKQRQFPGITYFSYQQKKLGRDLFTSLLKDIRAKYKNITPNDIAYFYTPPTNPYPRLGKLAWLNPFAIVKNFEYFQAQQYVTNLKNEAASTNGFKLICCQPKIDKKANILSKISKLGWMDPVKKTNDHQSSPLITPQHKAQQMAQKVPATHTHNLRERKQRLNK